MVCLGSLNIEMPVRYSSTLLSRTLFRLIRAPHQRTGSDHSETHSQSLVPERLELLGPIISLDGKIAGRRPQVLPNGQDLASDASKIAQNGTDLAILLTQTQHHARLGDEA